MIDLKSLSFEEVKKLSANIQREIDRRHEKARKEFARDVRRLAAEKGLDARDVFAEVARPGATSASPAKKMRKKRKSTAPATKPKSPLIFWNPVNPSEGWSGRGRKPNWVVTYLANGGTLEALKKKG